MATDIRSVPYNAYSADAKPANEVTGTEPSSRAQAVPGAVPVAITSDVEWEGLQTKCSQLTKEGAPCRSWASRNGLCAGHLRQAKANE